MRHEFHGEQTRGIQTKPQMKKARQIILLYRKQGRISGEVGHGPGVYGVPPEEDTQLI
jgi:hypothetical protein